MPRVSAVDILGEPSEHGVVSTFCHACGAKIREVKFCPKCGTARAPNSSSATDPEIRKQWFDREPPYLLPECQPAIAASCCLTGSTVLGAVTKCHPSSPITVFAARNADIGMTLRKENCSARMTARPTPTLRRQARRNSRASGAGGRNDVGTDGC